MMNYLSFCYSDPLPQYHHHANANTNAMADHFPESSTGSYSSEYCSSKAYTSDEEVLLLASNNPKKRAGRKKFRETRHPVYRGVRRRNSGKWVCEVREPNKKTRIWLGTFPTPEMAARAHDVAAIALRGRSACLNFADSAWRLPVPSSSEPKDIQKAAAEAADAFKPSSLDMDNNNNIRDDDDIPKVLNLSSGHHHDHLHIHEPSSSTTSMAEEVFFMDEEALFGMPGLLVNMAEGMMLPAPPAQQHWDDEDLDFVHTDVSLWSYSI